MPEPAAHVPVLLAESLAALALRSGATVVDGTLGLGGHAEALCEAVGPDGRVIGIDRDPRAIEIARERLGRFGPIFRALHGDHLDLPRLLDEAGVGAIDGILLDLGVSSMQLDDAARGFSFRNDGPLDMRMDPSSGSTAADLVASWTETELRRAIDEWGEERRAGAIARAIVRERARRPILRTRELAEIVERVHGPAARRFRIHPATRTFQALRIAVNREVVDLERMIVGAVERLRPAGRIVVISYHSLEDRAVKRTFRSLADRCICPKDLPICGCGRSDLVRVLTARPRTPSEAEMGRNPRSRSARLRAAERR